MTKKYDIIHLLDGFMYGVDKEIILSRTTPYIQNGNQLHIEGSDSHGICDCVAVIMSNNPSLGLPLLPDIEEDVVKLAKNSIDKSTLTVEMDKLIALHAWIDGYETASAKKYTEEDMEAAVAFGITLERFKKDKGKLSDTEEFKGFIQSLSPKPIAVEVEMDAIPADLAPNGWDVFLKLINNKVVVKQWIYEKK